MKICVHTWSHLAATIASGKKAAGVGRGGSRLLIELLQQHRGDQLRFIGTTWQAPRVWSGGVALRIADSIPTALLWHRRYVT